MAPRKAGADSTAAPPAAPTGGVADAAGGKAASAGSKAAGTASKAAGLAAIGTTGAGAIAVAANAAGAATGTAAEARAHALAADRSAAGRAASKALGSPVAAKQISAPKTVVPTTVINVDDISVADDSGHQREYGQNLLKKPSLLQVAGRRLECRGGGLKLADGKQTLVALKELKADWDALEAEARDDLGYTAALIDVLTVGIDVAIVEFADWDEDVSFAWAVAAHDVESNKYKATSLQDLVAVANRYNKRVPGGSWQATQTLLESVYGKSRRMFVYRMVKAAQALSPSVLERLAVSSLPPSFVHDNKYFLGTGADVNKKMSDEFLHAVILMASADLVDGKAVSASSFQSEYCAPLRHAEAWLVARRREFGEKLCSTMSFTRVKNFLLTARARAQLLQCMRAGIRLDGTSDEQPGIEQCRALVAELKSLHNQTQGNDATIQIPPTTNEHPEGEDKKDGLAPDASDGIETTTVQSMALGGAVLPQQDQAEIAATGRTDVALANLAYYASVPELQNTLATVVLPLSKVFFLIDAPTSKSKVVLKLIELASGLAKSLPTKRVKVAVSTGSRLELSATVCNKLEVEFPSYQVFNVQLSHGSKQHKRRRPAYALIAVPPDCNDDVPVSIAALAARGRPAEKLRLRCLDGDCALRPVEELNQLTGFGQSMAGLDADCEMNPDDNEGGAVDVDMVEGDAPPDALEAKEDEVVVPPGRRFVVDLWPFAYGSEFYKHLVAALFGEAASPNHIVVFTTSAHPGPQLAAHDLKAACHTVLDRIRVHSAAHGRKILKDVLYSAFHKEESAKQLPSAKRLLPSDLFFVTVRALGDQTTFFEDVLPDQSVSGWRAGLDQAPASKDLEQAVPLLIGAELGASTLTVKNEGGVRGLFTTKAMKEGDTVMVLRSLLFSDVAVVTEFLNGEGNSALLQGPLFYVPNVATAEADETARSLFAVPVGLGMFVRDYRGKKSRPNAVVKVHPAAGPNDGFLTLEVSTRNGCGIAAGSMIVADYGENCRSTAPLDCQSAKRFRGALDLVFARQAGDEAQVEETGGQGQGGGGKGGNDEGGAGSELTVATDENRTLVLTPDGKLKLRTKGTKPVKVFAKTVLHLCQAGKVDVVPDGPGAPSFTFPWKFEKGKDAVVAEDKKVTAISSVISTAGIEHLFSHASFTKGIVPPSFVVKKPMHFLPKTDEEAKIMKAAHDAQGVNLLWAIGVVQSNKIIPRCLAIVTAGQLTVKPGEDLVL